MKKLFKLFILINLLFLSNFAFAKTEKLTLLLDWFPNPSHAPIYVAKQQGFFKQQGLDIEILSPADPADPPKLAAAKQADLAISYQPSLVMAVNHGLPLVRIATLIATPLNCLVVLKDGPIKEIKDLKGKRVAYSTGGVDHAMLQGMLAAGGLTLKDVKLINVHYDLTQALLTNRVDAITGVGRNFEVFQMAIAGKPGKAFYPEEYGMPDYDELVIVTHKDNINDPRIKKFIIGLNQGVHYLVNHPDSTWEIFAKNHPELNNKLNKDAWFASISRFALRPAALDKSRYNNLANYLKNKGIIDKTPKLEDYAVEISY